MSERDTRDLMSVDAFSQLPFIRPAATSSREKTSPGAGAGTGAAVRLFGIEFPPDGLRENRDSSSSSSKENATVASSGAPGHDDTNRKFECHYCCRNFPTSQALGGHQNAHKRERQQAKRAHLQSAMAAHHHYHGIADGRIYGLLNYHRFGSFPPSTRFVGGFEPLSTHTTASLSHFPSWNGISAAPAAAPQYYCGPGSLSQPINGSPVPGLYRTSSHHPAAVLHAGGRERVLPVRRSSNHAAVPAPLIPLLGDESRVLVGAGASGRISGSSSSSSSSLSTQSRIYESAATGVKDHNLSLDLHL